jgi:hypothetical protein
MHIEETKHEPNNTEDTVNAINATYMENLLPAIEIVLS